MFNNVATVITKEFILSRVSEEEIFKKYLGLEPTERGSYTNPLRPTDTSPGCSFYVNPQGVWKFKDYAARYNWDCFNVVEFSYGLTFKEALIRIAIDFNIIDGNSTNTYRVIKSKKIKSIPEIRIARRPWTKEDYKFWARLKATPERLEFFKVYPAQRAWLVYDGELHLAYDYNSKDPCYIYHFPHYGSYEYKLYFPFRQKGKFIHTNSKIFQGYEQLPKHAENLLITKSYKDVIAIDFFSGDYDLYSGAPMSETVVILPELFTDLYNRFDNIGTLFDFDRTGITLARKYEKDYHTRSFFFGKQYRKTIFKSPVIKDFSDYLIKYGERATRVIIEEHIKRKNYAGDETPF